MQKRLNVLLGMKGEGKKKVMVKKEGGYSKKQSETEVET